MKLKALEKMGEFSRRIFCGLWNRKISQKVNTVIMDTKRIVL